VNASTCTATLFLLLFGPSGAVAQSAPASADRPWHSSQEGALEDAARKLREGRFEIDSTQTYSLAELIDLAERHNPKTRVAWERARAQAAVFGVARSEMYPTLAAAALSETGRSEVLFEGRFFRQTVQDFDVVPELNYTVFDFGARSGRSRQRWGKRSLRRALRTSYEASLLCDSPDHTKP
jgi:outer membrane protein